MVSSIVMIRYRLIISTIIDPRRLVFPEDLVPAISIVLEPSTMKLIMPAPKGLIFLPLINKGRVHGFSLCLRNAKARPVGFRGFVTTATLEKAPGIFSSVSRIGFASSKGRQDISLSLVAHDSVSSEVGMILVSQSSNF